ncbi:hypothetical protein QUF64_00965 [Anaerolineales bacterium HSG6]|nr:hypothetical protein [Anaerolineales bacterium HSG6]
MKFKVVTFLFFVLAVTMFASLTVTQTQAQAPQTASTGNLIDQAFTNGEITADQRLLHLTQAIYQPDALPSQYKSDARWSPTRYLKEIYATQQAVQSNKRASSPELAEMADIIAQQVGGVCDQTDGTENTDSTYFHINYDSGNLRDGLTIEDYKTALDNSYEVLINQYGMPKPPFCTDNEDEQDATCQTTSNLWDKYPIQISDQLEDGVLAYVTTGGSIYVGFVGDNPNTTNTEAEAWASCMVLGYDYSSSDDPKGLMEGTIAHEYFHAVQNAYGDADPAEDAMWFESTAAYIEDEVYDDRNTQYEYLYPPFTQQCLGEYANIPEDDSSGIYRNFMFFRYAAEHNGGANSSTDGSGKDIIQNFFMGLDSGKTALTSYNDALVQKGTNLNDTFHNFAIASRFMKSCSTASPYCYEEAEGYKNYQDRINPIADSGTIGAIGGSYDGSMKDNYALNWVGLPTSGSYKVSLQAKNGGEFRVSIVADTGTGLDVQAFSAVVKANETQSLTYTPPAGAINIVAVISNQQFTEANPAACAINTYQLSTEQSDGTEPTATPTSNPPGEIVPVAYLPLILRGNVTPPDNSTTRVVSPSQETTLKSNDVNQQVTVSFPIGAVSQETEATFNWQTNTHPLGNKIGLDLFFELTTNPSIETFNLPVEITVKIPANTINPAPYYWNGSTWSDEGIKIVSQTDTELIYTTDHFTLFTVLDEHPYITPTATSMPTDQTTATPEATPVTPTATTETAIPTTTPTATTETAFPTATPTATTSPVGDNAITNMQVDTSGAACTGTENVDQGVTWTISYDYSSSTAIDTDVFNFEANIRFSGGGDNDGLFDYSDSEDGFVHNSSDGGLTGNVTLSLCVDAGSSTSAEVTAFILDQDITGKIEVSLP